MLAERDPAAAGAWHTLFDQVTSTLRVPVRRRAIARSTRCWRACAGPVRETRLAAYEALFTALEPRDAACWRTSTTRSSPTASCSTACAATRTRARRATSTTSCPARPSTCCSPRSSATTTSRTAGSGTRRSCSGSTSSRSADQYAPLGSTRAVAYDDATVARGRRARRLLAAHRRRRARPLPRQPHRRRAALGQARRRVLRLDRPGRAAVHHDELHGSDGRRAHARARDRPRDAVPARRRAPDRALAPSAAGARRGAVDVRRDDRHRPPAGRRPTTRRCASGCSRRSVETAFATVFRQTHMVRYEQGAYGLRAEGKALMPDRLSEVWLAPNRPYYGDAVELPGGLPLRLVVHPALHPHALLHLRVRVRAPREPRALGRATARTATRSSARTSTSSRSAARPRRRSSSPASASTSRATTAGMRASPRSSG